MQSLRHILVPLDFSGYAEAALPYAALFARKYGAKITLLHVIPAQMYAVGEMDFWQFSDEVLTTLEESARQKLQALYSPAERVEFAIEERVRQGTPFVEILLEAEEQEVDLIVMATQGRTGIAHLMLGSITERIVREAFCPVLTIRPVLEEREAEK